MIFPSKSGWWSQTGSNRRPQACKASALPTELWPRCPTAVCLPDIEASADIFHLRVSAGKMVGLGRLELPTSRLSSARSNQLSYRPGSPKASHVSSPRKGYEDGAPARERLTSWCRYRTFLEYKVPTNYVRRLSSSTSLKGGDPAAGSPTATLLRLHPSR